MLNLVLLIVLVAALAGIIYVNRQFKHRGSSRQTMELLLLFLALLAGGIFMFRVGALSAFGLNVADDPGEVDRERDFFSSQGVVLGNFINTQLPDSPVLIVGNWRTRGYDQALVNALRTTCKAETYAVDLALLTHDAASNAGDEMMLPELDDGATALEIEQVIRENSHYSVVVIVGVNYEYLKNLAVLRWPDARRPAIFLPNAGSGITEWLRQQLSAHRLSGVVINDLSRPLDFANLPDSQLALFAMRYVLITPENLSENRRFYR